MLTCSNCIHIENDVLLYCNIIELENKLDNNYLYIPFYTFKRNIASIIYIPNATLFRNILDNYDFTKNDMENFSNVFQYFLINMLIWMKKNLLAKILMSLILFLMQLQLDNI